MESKHIYLDEKAIKHAEAIISTGVVTSISAAIRYSLAQLAPRVTPTTP